jgi:alpha-D-xyloside xylohydrolase
MPYLYALACEAHETGVPVMRPMMLEFGDDPACDYLDRQYMLGPALLVAPIFAEDGMVEYYLPPGAWTSYLTGQVVEGGRWVRESHGYLSLPLMVRENTMLPVGAVDHRPDYAYAEGVTFHVFPLHEGATCSAWVPASAGHAAISATAARTGDRIEFEARGATDGWSVLLRGLGPPRSVDGAVTEADPSGTLLLPEPGAERVAVHLEPPS